MSPVNASSGIQASSKQSPRANRRVSNRRNKRLEKRLTAYSSMASAVAAITAAGGGLAHDATAAIQVVDTNNLPAAGGFFGDLRAWDVDLDGVPDFYVDAGSYGYYPSFFIGGHPSGGIDNGFIANLKYQSYFMASYPFATNLESDAQVGGALTNFLPSAHLASSFSTLGGVYQGGDFLNTTGLLGFRFETGNGNLANGWALIETQGFAAGGIGMRILAAAYEDSGDPIGAGQIPEPTSLAFLALGAAGILAIRKHRSTADSTASTKAD